MLAAVSGFKPQRGKFTPSFKSIEISRDECFKPQRGKFTRKLSTAVQGFLGSFKPQRGKFTQAAKALLRGQASVSNPNGVNLHLMI